MLLMAKISPRFHAMDPVSRDRLSLRWSPTRGIGCMHPRFVPSIGATPPVYPSDSTVDPPPSVHFADALFYTLRCPRPSAFL